MEKIAVIALLYVIPVLPALAANDSASLKPNLEAPKSPADEEARFIVERIAELGKFDLLQVADKFSLYGKLSIPRVARAEIGMLRNAAAYGLHGQVDGARNMDISFGWDRYVTGSNSGVSLYSLTAIIRF